MEFSFLIEIIKSLATLHQVHQQAILKQQETFEALAMVQAEDKQVLWSRLQSSSTPPDTDLPTRHLTIMKVTPQKCLWSSLSVQR